NGVRSNVPNLDQSGVLGVYNNPVFGKTTMNLLAQLRLGRVNPSFGDGANVDSVKLYMPYYSRSKIVEADTTFVLDSVYSKRPMKSEVFGSKFFLRDLDPGSNCENSPAYYSDHASLFENYLGKKLGEIDQFPPKTETIVL